MISVFHILVATAPDHEIIIQEDVIQENIIQEDVIQDIVSEVYIHVETNHDVIDQDSKSQYEVSVVSFQIVILHVVAHGCSLLLTNLHITQKPKLIINHKIHTHIKTNACKAIFIKNLHNNCNQLGTSKLPYFVIRNQHI